MKSREVIVVLSHAPISYTEQLDRSTQIDWDKDDNIVMIRTALVSVVLVDGEEIPA